MRNFGCSLVLLLLCGGLGLALWLSRGDGGGDEAELTVAVLEGRQLSRATSIACSRCV